MGLSGMDEGRKKQFLGYAQGELEMRVGEKMSEGMSEEQLKEFEGLTEGNQEVIRKMVMGLGQDFREDSTYKSLLKKHGVEKGDWKILGEYMSIKWIEKNRPEYREIVKAAFWELKEEIAQNREKILAS